MTRKEEKKIVNNTVRPDYAQGRAQLLANAKPVEVRGVPVEADLEEVNPFVEPKVPTQEENNVIVPSNEGANDQVPNNENVPADEENNAGAQGQGDENP